MFRLGVVGHPETVAQVEGLVAEYFDEVAVLPEPFGNDAVLADAVTRIRKLQQKCDGLLYSRKDPYLLVAGRLQHRVPVRYVGTDSSQLLLSLLRANIRSGTVPADVSVDSFEPGPAAAAFAGAGLGPGRLRVRGVRVQPDSDGLVNATLRQHLDNHRAGSELCLTDITDVHHKLEAQGVPAELITPSTESFVHEIRNLMLRHQLRARPAPSLALVRIRLRYKARYLYQGTLPLREIDDLARAAKLIALFAEDVDSAMFQLSRFEYAFVCSEELLLNATDGYADFRLLTALTTETAFDAALGVGCGRSVSEAQSNALTAQGHMEALQGTHALVMTAGGSTIGPLQPKSDQHPEVAGTEVNLDMVARDTGLGLHVLHRLHELTRKRGTSLVTSARLAEHLHVSTRTANRILGRLLDNGYAGLEGKDLTRTKGRPARVIRLRL